MGQGHGSKSKSASGGKAEPAQRGKERAAAGPGVPSEPTSKAASPAKGSPGEPQYTVAEALALQTALKGAFATADFQRRLRRLEADHPRRGVRGHADQQKFTMQLHSMLLGVYNQVLPKEPWRLPPGWEGYRKMVACMESVAEDAQVVTAREEINRLLGLPRFTVLKPPAEEPVCIELLDGSGEDQSKLAPMLVDADGDKAHEFWEEDKGGNLRCVIPAATCNI